MKNNLDEYLKEIRTLNKQCSQYTEQIEKLKKDVSKIIWYIVVIVYHKRYLMDLNIMFCFQNENLQRNLDDFEKVVKVQHSRSMETELLEKNLKDMKIKLVLIV